jgi:hypothetical protein
MVRSFAVGTATLALVAALTVALPLNAGAQDTTTGGPTQTHYSTSITQVYGVQYPLAGHLDLEQFPNGTIRGYYHNAYQKAFIQVVGGRDGNYIWFDIGPTLEDPGLGVATGGKLHVVATINSDNSFRGQIYPESQTTDIGENVGATLSASVAGAPEQFVFAAKPIEKSSEDYQGTY